MTDIPDATLDRIHTLQEQQQQLQQQIQATLVTVMEANGLDPAEHSVDLETGTIHPRDDDS